MSDSTPRFEKTGIAYEGFIDVEKWEGGMPFPFLVVRATDSVVGLIVNQDTDEVILVDQNRPAMVREDNPDGSITELPAGRFDIDAGPKALLIKEGTEEAGVTLDADDITLLNSGVPMALSAGVLTERCFGGVTFIGSDAVEDSDTGYGVAAEGERIDRRRVSIQDFISYDTVHDCWRVFGMAMFLGRREAEKTVIALTEENRQLKARIAELEAQLRAQ